MILSLTTMDHQEAVPRPPYQHAQAKQSPALHINTVTLVKTLHLLTLCRLAVHMAHRHSTTGGTPF
jgi:hypothetical protein